MATYKGSAGISVGNVVGSNIANILLVLGVAALLNPITAPSKQPIKPKEAAPTNTRVDRIKKVASRLKDLPLTGIGLRRAATPKTSKMLAMLEPTTFPTEMPAEYVNQLITVLILWN